MTKRLDDPKELTALIIDKLVVEKDLKQRWLNLALVLNAIEKLNEKTRRP